MMAEEHRHRRAALAAESLLTSIQSQRNLYTQRSISSINRTSDDMPSEDLIAGARQNGAISNVRRFFCLFVTFDLFFTALVWLICTMIAGESLRIAFEKQVVHYQITTSLFDIVMAATCRFTVLLLFYALLHLNHRLIIALSTALTCVFLITKVSLLDWPQSSQPAFQGFLIITSFILAWGEAWFFDFRVIPQETAANDWILAGSIDPERAPLIQHIVDDPMGRVENPGNFFTPMDSPNHSDDEDGGPNEIGVSAGSIEESLNELPVMPKLTAEMLYESPETSENIITKLLTYCQDKLDVSICNGPTCTLSLCSVPPTLNGVFSTAIKKMDEYKNKAKDLIDRSYELLTSSEWTMVKTTPHGDKISTMNCRHGKIMKIEGIIDAPASELLDCLFENVEETPTWNKHVVEMKRMQTIDKNTDVVYQSTKSHGGGIIGPRDFITLRHRGIQGSYHISSGVSIHCPSIPNRKNYVRGENGLVCWATEAIESKGDEEPGTPGKCRFTWILNTNLKGWVPRTVIDKSMSIALTEFMGFLRNHVRELTDVSA